MVLTESDAAAVVTSCGCSCCCCWYIGCAEADASAKECMLTSVWEFGTGVSTGAAGCGTERGSAGDCPLRSGGGCTAACESTADAIAASVRCRLLLSLSASSSTTITSGSARFLDWPYATAVAVDMMTLPGWSSSDSGEDGISSGMFALPLRLRWKEVGWGDGMGETSVDDGEGDRVRSS